MVMSVQHITDKLERQNISDELQHVCNVQVHEKIRHHSEPGRPSSKLSECRRLYKFPVPSSETRESFTESGETETHFTLETPPLCVHGTAVGKQPKGSNVGVFNPPDPPKKRHCRSLSIPGDQTWGSDNALRKLHRPVALRPHHNNNHKMKSRHSPLMYNKRNSSSPLSSGFSSISPVTISLTSSDYFSTPPDSPVPRPASVSSGYYDSSSNSLNAPWLEHYQNTSHANFDLAKSRSLSFEGRISDNPSAGSLAAVRACVGSTPSSPRRQHILRCHSQPCVLHERDRKCGVKRRRGEDRPSLNFDKMHEKMRTRSIPLSYKPVRSLASAFADPTHILTSIASSPLDSHLPSGPSPTRFADKINNRDEHELISKNFSENKETTHHVTAERSDSGCCILDDPPDILDHHHANWGVDSNQLPSNSCQGDSELIFPLDCGAELDLDQIEND